MRRRLSLILLAAGIAMATIAACGSGDGDASGMRGAGSVPGVTGARATTATSLKLAAIGSFVAPVYITEAPGDPSRLFVVEQAGRIRIVKGGRTLAKPFLDIRGLVTAGGEQGLLSVAFPPDYARSGRFYVYYTDKQQSQRVVEYRRASADRANLASARVVLKMADPEPNHNGGLLLFGPDGHLYVGTGDGGGGGDQHGAHGNAQNLGSLLGKLLRIDPRASGRRPYTIPADNPFVRRGGGVRGEIYSYGLRNPWRFSFDRKNQALSIGDVGQDKVEEVDYVTKDGGRGANFGWRALEGSDRYTPGESVPGAIGPVLEHQHSEGFCSITGGFVVRDPALPASVRGQYVYGDFCQGRIRAATLSESGATGDHALALKKVPSLSSFGQDARGRIYVVSLSGPVYRLAAG